LYCCCPSEEDPLLLAINGYSSIFFRLIPAAPAKKDHVPELRTLSELRSIFISIGKSAFELEKVLLMVVIFLKQY
jgi:hypothetical protein